MNEAGGGLALGAINAITYGGRSGAAPAPTALVLGGTTGLFYNDVTMPAPGTLRRAQTSAAGVAPGGCIGCHNGTTATGKGQGHFVTARSCDVCHSIPTTTTPTGNWPARYTSHISPYYVAHSAAVNNNCASCHRTPSTEAITGLTKLSPAPTCYGCHAHTNSFVPGPHGKTETPSVKYTAVELHNCSGSCHFYLTTVGGALKDQPRPGPRHTPTNGQGMR